ncbi:Endochitinase [Wickerhamomyces ciferrii]|uniref:chitinase n=1 Tax=Wickerhamomyces ciferrii (strain ATCC 14091 / BCRC 22168 / CBS 111 / JCM 3599 / NBRC 0793 / NRRL Y-1031 F-60-10) TaxID=1206466 RepID=K0KL06_WICCF|nr:Endochitinase [Wickerhamomyces ciferrii]CCH41768.1 Endochitinase [Wickerhamomyces ciferrii]
MQFSKIFQGLSLATLASTVTAFDADSKDNVVVYWGQASAGSQEDLSYYCDSSDVDVVVLSFLSSFPGSSGTPTLDLSSACSDKFSNGLLKCPSIGQDIKSCQSKGKKILLALGGANGDYGFTGDSDGTNFADTLWNLFGEGESDTRPFGDAAVDGFDFDIENKNQEGYVALAKALRTKFSSSSKQYYLSAAPQCVYPDESVGDLLAQADIDFAFIQFYNNYCSLDKQFNWDTWAKYAKSTSPNKNIKLFVGLPGAQSAAGSGYVDISTVKTTLSTVGSNANFGGIMLWDASQAFTNKVNGGTFAHAIKQALSSLGGSVSNDDSNSSGQASSSTVAASSSTGVNAGSTSTSSVNNGQYQQPSSAQVSTSSVNNGLYQPSASAQAPVSSVNNGQYQASTSSVNNGLYQPSSQTQAASISVDQGQYKAPVQQSSNSLSYQEVTTNTFSASPSSFTSVLTSSQTQQQEQAQDSTSQTAASAQPTGGNQPSKIPDECSSLSGISKAQCLNKNYKSGQYDGKPTDCEHGSTACSANGEYSVCNWGQWVNSACSSGSTCFAFNQGDNVLIGCNYQSVESQFAKRFEHVHHDHI